MIPRAYFGGLGGHVGAPGDLLEAARRALLTSRAGFGAHQEGSRAHFGSMFGRFWK